MRIAIRHSLSIFPPPGTGHLVVQVLLTPQSGPTQTVESWTVEMAGLDEATRFTDAYGNTVHLVNRNKPEGPVAVTASGVVSTRDSHGVLGRPGGEPVPVLFKRITLLTRVPVTLYGKFRSSKESRIDVLHGLMLRVSETLDAPSPGEAGQTQSQGPGKQSQSQGTQIQELEPTPSSADGVLVGEEAGHEVVARLPRPPATDYAHMFVGGARALGIPARYVTGYLTGEDDEPAAFHAWAEAFDEKLGWIGFDAMLQLCPTDRHVRLAAGLDAISAAPLRCVPGSDGVVDNGVTIQMLGE
ncbi:MAG: Transglutaminase-like enzyme putative cysteine protease [Devosia sp.]|nr:Transglutaminase-like enzyme putative cysteine protease [Devosia sp.]